MFVTYLKLQTYLVIIECMNALFQFHSPGEWNHCLNNIFYRYIEIETKKKMEAIQLYNFRSINIMNCFVLY